MRAKLAPPLTLTLALVGLLVLAPGAASSAAPNAWDEPITLSESGGSGNEPQLVTDGNTITAVWDRNGRIQASFSTDDGSTWSTPVDISADGVGASGVQVGIHGTTIIATWAGFDGTDARMQASTSTNGGGTWSTPVYISATREDAGETQEFAYDAQLVLNGATIAVTWTTQIADGSGFDPRIKASSSTDGGLSWSTPVNLSDSVAYGTQLVISGNTITATWSSYDDVDNFVQASFSIDGGLNWSTPATIFAGVIGARLVSDGDTITATWQRYDGTNDRIQTSSSTDGGLTWSTPVNVSAAGEEAYDPRLVTDGDTITAAWQGEGDFIQTSSSTDGGTTWSTPVTLSDIDEEAYDALLVTDGDTITATWEGYDGNSDFIQTSSSTDGGTTWSTPVTLSDIDGGAYNPQMVTDGDTITVIWEGNDGNNDRVQVSSFTAVAPVVAVPELAATGLGDQTTTLGVLALILMLGGITVVGARTMTQRTAQHLSPRR